MRTLSASEIDVVAGGKRQKSPPSSFIGGIGNAHTVNGGINGVGLVLLQINGGFNLGWPLFN
jgi:hypothetical protein